MNEFLEKEPLNWLHLRLPEAGEQCGDEIAAPELVSVGELKICAGTIGNSLMVFFYNFQATLPERAISGTRLLEGLLRPSQAHELHDP